MENKDGTWSIWGSGGGATEHVWSEYSHDAVTLLSEEGRDDDWYSENDERLVLSANIRLYFPAPALAEYLAVYVDRVGTKTVFALKTRDAEFQMFDGDVLKVAPG